MDLNETDQKTRDAVRSLRNRLELTQTQFAALMGVSYPSVQRYEQLVPPKGHKLARFRDLAISKGFEDLGEVFHSALVREVGRQGVISGEYDWTPRQRSIARLGALISDLAWLRSSRASEAVASAHEALLASAEVLLKASRQMSHPPLSASELGDAIAAARDAGLSIHPKPRK